MDQPKIERLLRLMKMMSGSVNYSIEELSDKLDMSKRTIYRYIDTFKNAGFAVTKMYGNIYRLGKMPKNAPDFDRLIYFSEEEAMLVNGLIDSLSPTNSLKANLKDKLSVIYNSTSIADYVSDKSNAASIEALGEAMRDRRKAVLRNYESGNSKTIRDRLVEPFGFTSDYVELWAFDLEDGRNKVFKVSRIEEVSVLEEEWTCEDQHRIQGRDVFHMSGDVPQRIRFQMSVRAKNLLFEEFPLARKDCHREGPVWILDTQVYGFAGVCRFVVGLAEEVKILESEPFKEYVSEYIKNNVSRLIQ
ncbi:MAG: WYL domain-containing protein [Bacteroidales bacterium]|nr:WYL domain-containing protein [Bacteroidales bacterium]